MSADRGYQPGRWMQWQRSSRTYGGGNCVDVATALPTARGGYHAIYVSDSKDPHGERLLITRETWRSFVQQVKDGSAVTSGGGRVL